MLGKDSKLLLQAAASQFATVAGNMKLLSLKVNFRRPSKVPLDECVVRI